MKGSVWLAVIAVLNFLATTVITGRALVLSAGPLRPVVLTLLLLMAGVAGAIGIGLWKRSSWARRGAIVLWLFCTAFMVSAGLMGGFVRFGAWSAPAGVAPAVGVAVIVVLYLSQPQIKQTVAALDGSFSREKTIGLILAIPVVALLAFRWLVMELGKAVGKALR